MLEHDVPSTEGACAALAGLTVDSDRAFTATDLQLTDHEEVSHHVLCRRLVVCGLHRVDTNAVPEEVLIDVEFFIQPNDSRDVVVFKVVDVVFWRLSLSQVHARRGHCKKLAWNNPSHITRVKSGRIRQSLEAS